MFYLSVDTFYCQTQPIIRKQIRCRALQIALSYSTLNSPISEDLLACE